MGCNSNTSGKAKLKAKSAKIDASAVSATGANSLTVKGFPNKQKLNNHWLNGRTHKEEYIKEGIVTTAKEYEARAVQLAESAADGKNILGYKSKEGYIC